MRAKRESHHLHWLAPRAFRTLQRLSVLLLLCGGIACDSDRFAVSGIEPTVADYRTQSQVKIIGQGFKPEVGYSVYFGKAKAQDVAYMDANTLVARPPTVTEPGTADVTVVSDLGPGFLVRGGFKFVDLSGNPVEHM